MAILTGMKIGRLMGNARRAFRAGRIREAEEYLWEAIRLLEVTPNLTRMREAFSLLEEGYRKAYPEEQLLELYRRWIQRDPENPEVIRSLARVYVKRGECARAVLEVYRKALTFYPDDAVILVGYGECLIKEGKSDGESIEVIERAVDRDKLWVKGFKYLQKIYSGIPEKAADERRVLQRLHFLKALDKAGLNRYARMLAADEDTSAESMEVYQEALSAFPSLLEVAKVMAKKVAGAKKISPEIVELLQSCARHTGGAPILDLLFVKYALQVGEKDYTTIQQAKNAATHFPQDEEVLSFAARNLPGTRDVTKEAMEIYRRYFQIHPKDREFLARIVALFSEAGAEDPWVLEIYKAAVTQGVTVPEKGLKRVATLLAQRRDSSPAAGAIYRAAHRLGLRTSAILELLAVDLHRTQEISTLAEEIFRSVFDLTLTREIKLLSAEGIYRQIHSATQIPPAYAVYLDYLLRENRLPEVTPAIVDALAPYYLSRGAQDEKALQVYQGYLQRHPEEKTFRWEVVPFFIQQGITSPFALSLYAKFYEEGGRTPQVLDILLKQELSSPQRSPLFFPIAMDILKYDLPIIRQIPGEIWQEVARFAFQNGRFSEALLAIQKAMALGITDGELLYLKAKSLLATQKLSESREILQTLGDGFASQRAYWLGVIGFLKGDWEMAHQHFIEATKEKTLAPFALARIGLTFEKQRLPGKAMEVYQKAAGYKSVAGYVWSRIGKLCMQAGQYEAAVDAYRRALSQGEKSASRELASALYTFATIQAGKGHYPQAAVLLSEALKQNWHNKSLWKSAVQMAFRAGLSHYARGQYKEASRWFNETLSLNYKFYQARFYLALSYHHLKEVKKSLVEYEELLRTPLKSDEQVRYYSALAQFEDGRPECVREFYHLFLSTKNKQIQQKAFRALIFSILAMDLPTEIASAIQIPQEEVQATFPPWIYASFLLKLKRYDETIRVLSRSRQKDPDDPKILFFLGLSYLLKGDRSQGLPYWHRIMDLNPAKIGDRKMVVDVYTRIGFFFMEEGFTDKALEAWERIKAFDPTNRYADFLLSAAYKQVGYALAKRDKLREAVMKWDLARRLYPRDLEVLHNLALAFTILGEWKDAARLWKLLQNHWKRELDKTPDMTHYAIWLEESNNFLSSQEDGAKPSATALTRANAEDYLSFVKRANQFYWFLGLEKNATVRDVERRYFKLIKTYGPEKHPEEFILLEEAYQHLTNPKLLEKSLLYTFDPVNLNTLRTELHKYKIFVEDFLFWERNLIPFDQPLKLEPGQEEKEFEELPSVESVFPPLEVETPFNDWHL